MEPNKKRLYYYIFVLVLGDLKNSLYLIVCQLRNVHESYGFLFDERKVDAHVSAVDVCLESQLVFQLEPTTIGAVESIQYDAFERPENDFALVQLSSRSRTVVDGSTVLALWEQNGSYVRNLKSSHIYVLVDCPR